MRVIVVILKNLKNDGTHETITVYGEYCYYTDEYFNIGNCDDNADAPKIVARFNREDMIGYYIMR